MPFSPACRSRRLALAAGLLALAGCQRPATSACIDPANVNPAGLCPMVYEAVCGRDGKTYANSCVAGLAGVRTYQPGACPTPPGSR